MFFEIGFVHVAIHVCTESFKGLPLELYGFYLVILPPGIRSTLMKYHINPLGYDLFLYP